MGFPISSRLVAAEDTTQSSPRAFAIWENKQAAMGERQMLPWQTKSIFTINPHVSFLRTENIIFFLYIYLLHIVSSLCRTIICNDKTQAQEVPKWKSTIVAGG